MKNLRLVLPPLLRKAAGDAGFDLVRGEDGEWTRLGVSGVRGVAWIVPLKGGALLGLDSSRTMGEFTPLSWTEVPLPAGARGAVHCASPADLYHALRRVRVVLAQTPPAPEERFAERLKAVTTTEKESVVRQRVGQSLFREMLLDYWEGRCAVTGLDVPELLRASHAKPWSVSTDRERLDLHNGLLLAVHLDALFDQGFITFDDEGETQISRELPESSRPVMLGDMPLKLSRLTAGHQPYLHYHRRHVFRHGEKREVSAGTTPVPSS